MMRRTVAYGLALFVMGCGDSGSSTEGGGATGGTGGGGAGASSGGGAGAGGSSGGQGGGGAAPKEVGETCGEPGECASEFCVDAVCCASACTDLCFACSADQTGEDSGVCAPVVQGNDPHDDCVGDLCIDDVCDGSGACQLLPNETLCRGSVGPCDPAEGCADGVCPADEKLPASTPCRQVNGDCDVEEVCDGSSDECPLDGFQGSTVVCRPAVGVCDVEETCGDGPSCAADMFAPATTECGAHLCAGTSADCETSCTVHADCAANAFCNTLGSCTFGKIAFTTSTTTNGNIGGLNGADALCQARAGAAGLPGIYRAWLSDSQTSAASRLNQAATPYAYINGLLLALNWADLTDGSIANPFRITEFGVQVPGNLPFTSTAANGTAMGPGFCADWTSASGTVITGQSDQTGTGWTAAQSNTNNCGILHRLYCLQQ